MPERSEQKLTVKTELSQSPRQIGSSLLAHLEEGMVAVYCGPHSTPLIESMAERVGEKGRLIIIDNSFSLHSHSEFTLPECPQLIVSKNSIESLKEIQAYSHFTLSLFTLECSRHPEREFEKLEKLTEPGGFLICGELDNIHHSHYPLAEHLQMQMSELARISREAGVWNPETGRALFQHFNESDFRQVSAELVPHGILAGRSDWNDIQMWRERLDIVEAAIDRHEIKISFDFKVFRREFFSFFENPNRFSYSPMILISGMRGA